MSRFSLALTLLLATSCMSLNTVGSLEQLRVGSGPYRDAYRLAPDGGINWYFANVALQFVIEQRPDQVRRYLDAYLSHVRPADGRIADVDFLAGVPVEVAADSDDAYAATFLRLASRYVARSGDDAWMRRNVPALKTIAYRNILQSAKPNGLVRVFQDPRVATAAYLMDNCEAFEALILFAELLDRSGDPEAAYYRSFASGIERGIHTLWDSATRTWRVSDEARPPDLAIPYPDALAQVYPRICGVKPPDGSHAPLVAGLLDRIAEHDSAFAAFVAARDGQLERARSLLATRPVHRIDQLGYLIAAREEIASRRETPPARATMRP